VLEHCNTYHALGALDVWQKWKNIPGVLYTIKANQFLTHSKSLKPDDEVKEHIKNFMRDRVAGIMQAGPSPKCGAVLIQLPATFRCTDETLQRVRDVGALITAEAPNVPVAIEFRHPSWACAAAYDVLKQLRWSLVATNNPPPGADERAAGGIQGDFFFDDGAMAVNLAARNHTNGGTGTGMLYIRLHGSVSQFQGDYGREKMRAYAKKIRLFLEKADKSAVAFCFLNNNETQLGGLTSSVVDATALGEEIFGLGPIVHAPPPAAAPAGAAAAAAEVIDLE
jgi:uncharacterized protein YecE (DUF72 family)